MEKEKKYCVYGHYYNDELFYIGSGRIYEKDEGQIDRAYRFDGRSPEWKKFCNLEIDKVVVEILFETNDQQEALHIEEHITRMYIDRAHLVNKNFGNRHSAEHKRKIGEGNKGKIVSPEARKKISLARKGKAANTRKVLITNNLNNESIVFDSIKDTYKFILQHGFDKTQGTLQYHLNKGSYSFNEYTMELV